MARPSVVGCKALLVDTNRPSSSVEWYGMGGSSAERYGMGGSSAELSGTSLHLLLMALVLTTLCWGIPGTVLVKDAWQLFSQRQVSTCGGAGVVQNLAGRDVLCACHATCSGCRTEDWCVLGQWGCKVSCCDLKRSAKPVSCWLR